MLNLIVSALPCPYIFAMLSCLSKEMHVKALLAVLGVFAVCVHIVMLASQVKEFLRSTMGLTTRRP